VSNSQSSSILISEQSVGHADYRRSIRAAVRGRVSGIFDEFTFVDTMISTIQRGLTRAFHEGLAKFGIAPDEITTPERLVLDELINLQFEHLFGFSAYVTRQGERYAQGQKQPALNAALSRADLWVNRYPEARSLGEALGAKNIKATWVLGATEEHCRTCLGFFGRTYRYETWLANEAMPQSQNLCCGGYRCDCHLEPTDARVTPGRFPRGLLCA
jgi:hypothetical protein